MGIPLTEAKVFPSFTLAATLTGYLIGILLIPKYIKQVNALRICTLLGLLFSCAILFVRGNVSLFNLDADASIWFVVLIGLANSLIWAGIWPLAMRGLGKLTKIGTCEFVDCFTVGVARERRQIRNNGMDGFGYIF